MDVLNSLSPTPFRLSSSAISSLARTCCALIYAYIVLITPWEVFLGEPYFDRAAFIEGFAVTTPMLESLPEQGWGFVLAHEFLWDTLIRFVSDYTGGTDETFLWVTFICAFLISRFVFKYYFSIVSFVLLLNPIVVDLVSSQLRFAFATTLALVLYERFGRLFQLCLLLVLISIHTASILVLPVLWYAKYLAEALKGRPTWQFVVCIFVPIMAFLIVIGPLRETILGVVDNSRDADFNSQRVGLGYNSAWVLFLIFAVLNGRQFFEHHFSIVAFYFISLFFLMNIAGFYGLRFLANVYPFFIVSTVLFRKDYRIAYQGIFFCYQILQWLSWSKVI